MYPYTLNNAVDTLLKSEFDQYRAINKPHPYLVQHGIDAIPLQHGALTDWRMNQRGVQYYHEVTNFLVTGAVDDIWINSQGELIVVDYKATSTQNEVSIEDRGSYKRQMDIYQWLLRKNGFKVSNTAYFVYCNGDAKKIEFDGVLQFQISLIPYEGDDSWIERALFDIKDCLKRNMLPVASVDCNYCSYWIAVDRHIKQYKNLSNVTVMFKKRRRFNKK